MKLNTSSQPQPAICVKCSEQTLARVVAYVQSLKRRMTPEQLASQAEEWELICEQRGWIRRPVFDEKEASQ